MEYVQRFGQHTQYVILLLLVLAIAGVGNDVAAIRRNSPEITRESQRNLNVTSELIILLLAMLVG